MEGYEGYGYAIGRRTGVARSMGTTYSGTCPDGSIAIANMGMSLAGGEQGGVGPSWIGRKDQNSPSLQKNTAKKDG